MAGKTLGSALGAGLARAGWVLRRYLGLCLASQAGVAVGLAILAGMRLGPEVGEIVTAVVTATVFVFEIAGPPMVRYAIVRAGEAGRNVTEEDLQRSHTVGEVMNDRPCSFRESTPLSEMLHEFSQNDCLAFPVLDEGGGLKGVVTIQEIREGVGMEELGDWLLAADLMGPVRFRTNPGRRLDEALEEMRRNGTDYAPVVYREDDRRLAGMLERGAVQRTIASELLRRQAGES
jgi:CBS domain-containing protein